MTPRPALVDAFIQSCAEWREECRNVQTAYERWIASEPQQRRFAFLGYRAALDREEAAARFYESCAEHLMREKDRLRRRRRFHGQPQWLPQRA